MQPRFAITLLALSCIGAIAPALVAGPLSPPPGPPSSTHKTLTQIEPRTPVQSLAGSGSALHVIDQPGSYYLTGNITGVAGKHGISIRADNVTLDLNGFSLIGVPGSGSGITQEEIGRKNCHIRNGAAKGWGEDGFNGGNLSNSVLSDLIASNNGRAGMNAGTNCIVYHCVADANAFGISVYISTAVIECKAHQNAGEGLRGTGGASFLRCLTRENGIGIRVIDPDGATEIVESSCLSDGTGISSPGETHVSRCTVNLCAGDGIVVGGRSIVSDSLCRGNGTAAASGAGIRCTGSGTRIEGNNMVGNDVGVVVTSSASLVVRNSFNGNAVRDSIVAGNSVGPFITSATIGTNTNPHANYAF